MEGKFDQKAAALRARLYMVTEAYAKLSWQCSTLTEKDFVELLDKSISDLREVQYRLSEFSSSLDDFVYEKEKEAALSSNGAE